MKLLQSALSKEELRQLCHELGLNYDDLPGEGNAAKALSLVELAERQDALDVVVEAARRRNPQVNWDAALTPSAAAAALTTPARSAPRASSPLPAALPPPPQYGFHGRSREMLALERAFADVPLVVLHGFGGLGKTALAAEAGRWFTRTGRFPGGAAFISVEHGGSLEQICSWVGQAISGDPDWVIHGEGDMAARVGQLLAAQPALLILDNFESLLGRDAADAAAGAGRTAGGAAPVDAEQQSAPTRPAPRPADYHARHELSRPPLCAVAKLPPHPTGRIGDHRRAGAGGGGAGRPRHRPRRHSAAGTG